jgi:hypothetical protein
LEAALAGPQQAHSLVMQPGNEHPFRFLLHDRDTKFSQAHRQTAACAFSGGADESR